MNATKIAPPLSKTSVVTSWILRIVTAIILFQTLFFKFTGSEESIYIFETLGMEPWGRWAGGAAELLACILLLVPRTVPFGAALALAVMVGALGSHLTRLGIVVNEDGGLLFGLAILVFASSASLLIIHRRQFLRLGSGRTA
jgi:uncharacterized membrane protein YphA (DoxX/SURF4 family)